MEGGSAARDELSLAAELVERELEALRAVDGVTSATAKDRTSLRKPLNTMVAKVRLQGRSNALTVVGALRSRCTRLAGGRAEGRHAPDRDRRRRCCR